MPHATALSQFRKVDLSKLVIEIISIHDSPKKP
jgi:hypothetical protein